MADSQLPESNEREHQSNGAGFLVGIKQYINERRGLRLATNIFFRLFYGALSILFIVFVTFVADEIAPGDAATYLAGEKATQAQVEQMRKEMGLDRPWPVRFGEYLVNLSKGDLGQSFGKTEEPVIDIIKRTLGMTSRIAVLAILLAAGIGLLLGTIAAIKENKAPDRLALGVSTLGVTLPNFVLAPVFVLIFAIWLDVLPGSWQPESRQVAPQIYYLILPVLVMAARPLATLTRLTRASLIDTLSQDFVRFGVAIGVPPFRLFVLHALRNAILPVITGIGTSFGYLLTGSFIVETFFSIPGIGAEAIRAIREVNGPVLMGCVIVTGTLFILVNLVVDLFQQLIDPRIRESQI